MGKKSKQAKQKKAQQKKTEQGLCRNVKQSQTVTPSTSISPGGQIRDDTSDKENHPVSKEVSDPPTNAASPPANIDVVSPTSAVSSNTHVKIEGAVLSDSSSGNAIPDLPETKIFESRQSAIPAVELECTLKFSDFNHTSLLKVQKGKSKKLNQLRDEKKASSIRGYHPEKKFDIRGELISSGVEDKPTLQILKAGFDLESELKPWCCFGRRSWQGRAYAQELSSNFSSPSILLAEEKRAETVDFVADWANMKALLKSQSTDVHLSYLVHRVGNTVTVDHLDLVEMMLIDGFMKLPPDFVRFAKGIMGKNKLGIKTEGRSNKEKLNKEAYHRLLHSSMKTPMKLVTTRGKTNEDSSDIKKHFLNHAIINVGKFKILAGSDIPLYLPADNVAEAATVRAIYDKDNGQLGEIEALDLWLDNTLLGCSRTHLVNLEDSIVSKSQWINTKNLLHEGELDVSKCFESANKLLQFLQENVKTGNSYWLYREPGSYEISLYNVSSCIRTTPDEEQGVSILDVWEPLKPYVSLFAVASLSRYTDCLSESITEKLITEMVFEPRTNLQALSSKQKTGFKNSGSSTKLRKLNLRLQNIAKTCKQQIKSSSCKGNWLIHDMEDIRSTNFERIVNCVKGTASTVTTLVPSKKISFYRHAVERYLQTCVKLIKSLGLNSDRNLKFWEATERKRKWMEDYIGGVCKILKYLSTWHQEVLLCPTEFHDSEEKDEWMYLGCRIQVLYADGLAAISTMLMDPSRNLEAHKKQPSQLDNLLDVQTAYDTALCLIPDVDFIKVKQSFLPSPCNSHMIARSDLLDEVHEKIAFASVHMARFDVNTLQFYIGSISHDINSCEKLDNEEGFKSTKIIALSNIISALDKSLQYAKKVKNKRQKGGDVDKVQAIQDLVKSLQEEIDNKTQALISSSCRVQFEVYHKLEKAISSHPLMSVPYIFTKNYM